MNFKQTFERNLNDEMEADGEPGRAPTQVEHEDSDIKKGAYSPQHEQCDDKKDQPPRFSTLYGVAPKPAPMPAPPPPQPQPREYEYQREYYPSPPRARRSGVTIPMPLFIVFAIILAFESTILFAYTIIGLYNNAPSRIFPWAGPGTATAICNPSEQQPAINFAPNFVMPQAEKAVAEASVETVTVTPTPSTTTISATASTITISASISSTPSSTTSSTSTSSTSSADKAIAASDILGILGGLVSTSSATPAPSTVTSVKLITKDPSGNILSGNMVTLTSTTVVPAGTPAATISSRDEAVTSITTAPSVSSSTATGVPQSVIGGWDAVSSAIEQADSSSATATSSSA